MRILIAEDDPISRRLLEATLTRWGHDVMLTVNGSQAAHALLRPDGPRLAIIDWMMPNMDGLEVCRRIRERLAPYIYLILLTAKDRREDLVRGLEAGADDFLVKPFDMYELQARLRAGQRIVELQESILESQAALRQAATRDPLTGLWNRGAILDRLHRETDRAVREGGQVAVVFVDLDRFKQVNDSYGHPAGDSVLVSTADCLKASVRTYDEVGRYGGEEFLMVLPQCTAREAAAVAERARLALSARPIDLGGVRQEITASFGVAAARSEGADSLLRRADAALYRAKEAGRNRVELALDDPSSLVATPDPDEGRTPAPRSQPTPARP
jgi:two-component system, cell cycle response regulator